MYMYFFSFNLAGYTALEQQYGSYLFGYHGELMSFDFVALLFVHPIHILSHQVSSHLIFHLIHLIPSHLISFHDVM